MQHLVESTRQAVADRNLYAALSMALTLPDICGRLSDPHAGTKQAQYSKDRYVAWCNRYLIPAYTHKIGAQHEEHVFLSGEDTYALRCAVLHEGSDSIVAQRARKALDQFVFLDMPRTHCNRFNQMLQLDVSTFCEDVCSGVDAWLHDSRFNPARRSRIEQLMKIGKPGHRIGNLVQFGSPEQ